MEQKQSALPALDSSTFVSLLQANGVRFFTGVPDSLLKELCSCIQASVGPQSHVIAANEGSAVALAIGHHLATGAVPLVYMQNSGLGNAINPLVSLADPLVYSIPMLLLVGWRGELDAQGQQAPDEPQHQKQGRVTLAQLDALNIDHAVLARGSKVEDTISQMLTRARQRNAPVALVVRKNTFAPYGTPGHASETTLMTRESAIATTVECLVESAVLVTTTGMASRELFEIRKARGDGHQQDFLTVGGMGHASQIACGIALAQPHRTVVCLDGDGAVLMHMGALPYVARQANMIHVVINNGAHDSVGGQPTLARDLRLSDIARSCGYHRVARVSTQAELADALSWRGDAGSLFVEVLCKTGHRPELGRPTVSPVANKEAFMRNLG